MQSIDLSEQVAVVTGSGRGLGLAFARALARAGAAVVVNDIDSATAKAAVATIEGEGGKAVCEVVPVGDKLALWSHPQELKAAYHEHGWTAQSIASIWDSSIGLNQETVGLPSA